jgi:hypothetical protein
VQALHGFFVPFEKNFVGMNLSDFRHQFVNNILTRAFELGEMSQWPVAG